MYICKGEDEERAREKEIRSLLGKTLKLRKRDTMTFWPERIREKSKVRRRSSPETTSSRRQDQRTQKSRGGLVDGTELKWENRRKYRGFFQHPRATDDRNAKKNERNVSGKGSLLCQVRFSEQLHPYTFPKWQKVGSL